MELIARVGVLLVVIVAVAAAGFLLFTHSASQQGPVTKTQAESLVYNDVKLQNPNATITIVNASPSSVAPNSWSITLAVVYNATRPCPTLFIEAYDYPATGFVPSTDNLYTRGCVIYGLATAPYYVISSPDIAVVGAYNTSSWVQHYVSVYGYNSVTASASFYANLTASATPLNMSYSNIWLVNFTATQATYSEYVLLGQSGTRIANYTIARK